jgi:hypothetical protein
MHGLGIPSIGPLSSVASQAITSLANRASTAATNFETDLQSGNIAGAQSFLGALQQKLSSQSTGAAGSAISAQITKVSNDLKSGDLSAAQTDFASLRLNFPHQQRGANWPASGNGAAPASCASGAAADPTQAALQSYNVMQQMAFNSALNLSLPEAAPSLSINS